MSKVRIVVTGHGRGEVYVDDVRVEKLTGFKVECGVGEINRLHLSMIVDEIEFEGEAVVE